MVGPRQIVNAQANTFTSCSTSSNCQGNKALKEVEKAKKARDFDICLLDGIVLDGRCVLGRRPDLVGVNGDNS